MRTTSLLIPVVAMFSGACAGTLAAQVEDPDPLRFAEAIEAFAAIDSHNTIPANAVLFVGSSSIRFWPTAERFPHLTVVNRGFGGSHISDVNHYAMETVIKYAPELVVHYAGDNDISAGKSAQQVFEDYREFTERVLAELPQTQILFIGLKPSVLRWATWPEMEEVNRLVREYSESVDNLHYVDVAGPMLGGAAEPDPSQFVEDGLHLSESGYDIWTDVVGAAIDGIRAIDNEAPQ